MGSGYHNPADVHTWPELVPDMEPDGKHIAFTFAEGWRIAELVLCAGGMALANRYG
jgi:hypothetical protein